MEQLIHRLLSALKIILPYTIEGNIEYRCNLLNPLSWVLLIFFGVYQGFASVVMVIKESLDGERLAAPDKKTSKSLQKK